MNKPQYRCSRCVLDTTVPEIVFDASGVCQYCHMYDELAKIYPSSEKEQKRLLDECISKIKTAGKGKRYDCIIGVSGGTDSSFLLKTVVELGLRPLAVHFDNGWNSAIAVTNVKNLCDNFKVDLDTTVADWREFKSLQNAFLKASVPDVEIPTDVAIFKVLHLTAAREGVKYILYGHSFRTEGLSPLGWTYMDGRYIESVNKLYGTSKLKDFKNFKLWDYFFFIFLKGIKSIAILNFIPYNKNDATKDLEKNCGWTNPGGHHHESYYTKFVQSYILPQKFKIDKRKTELSAMINSGHTSRKEALAVLSKEYPYEEELIDYSIQRLGWTRGEWDAAYAKAPLSFKDYPTYYRLIKLMKLPIMVGGKFGLFSKLLYLKFLGPM